jgi:hypothetical protein
VFENRVKRRIFGLKRGEIIGDGGSCTMTSFIIRSTHPQISLGRSSRGGRSVWAMRHACERREKCARFWWESPMERDHSED